jgi:cytochrome b6-f complex iron-sulfur subunit
VLLLLGIFAVASRRAPTGDATPQKARFDPRAERADRAARRRRNVEPEPTTDSVGDTAVATLTETEVATRETPPPDPAIERVEVTPNEYGVTRRKFFNRAVFAIFALFLAQFALAGLAFFWPKLKGGFGAKVNAGSVESLKDEVTDGATIVPVHATAAQAWIVPFPLSELPGSSYEGVPFVIAGGESDGVGLMAMWQRCVHLGCKVPECLSSQGFECPCHGSKYNIHGEYDAGPAPRNLDRFAVEVNDAGDLIIDTGTIVQTPRSKTKTASYPQGPFCV